MTPLKFKILRVRWKDAHGETIEGARISAVRLTPAELEQLAHEILRVVADCRAEGARTP